MREKRVVVFRFLYRDRNGHVVLADDYATAEAIAQIHGIIQPDTALEVDSATVGVTSGILIKANEADSG